MVDAPAAPSRRRPIPAPPPPTADEPAPRWPAWAPWALVAVLVAARVGAIAVLLSTGVADEHSVLGGDARRYAEYFNGGTPYRDFPVEYPPLTLGLAWLVHRPSLWANIALLAASQLVIELVITTVLWRTWGRRAGIAFLVLGTPMIFFPFPYVRIDLLAVLLAVGGAALGRRRHPVTGGAVLALAVFAKVWPVVLAPAMLVRRQWRGLLGVGRHRPGRPGGLGGVGRHVGARPGGHLPGRQRLADRELPGGRHPHDRPGLVPGRAGGVAHGRRGAGLGEGPDGPRRGDACWCWPGGGPSRARGGVPGAGRRRLRAGGGGRGHARVRPDPLAPVRAVVPALRRHRHRGRRPASSAASPWPSPC